MPFSVNDPFLFWLSGIVIAIGTIVDMGIGFIDLGGKAFAAQSVGAAIEAPDRPYGIIIGCHFINQTQIRRRIKADPAWISSATPFATAAAITRRMRGSVQSAS